MSLEQKANSLERRVDGLVAAGGDFAIPVLAAISSRLDVFPPVKSATSGALFIFNQVKESQENKETWASFGKYVVDVVADAVISTKSYARCDGEAKPWAESITKLNDVLHEITYQMRAEMVGPLAIMNPSLDLRDRLKKYLDGALASFQLKTISTVSLTSSGKENFQDHPACRQWDDPVFSQLLYPRDTHHDPRKACLEGTRAALIERIMAWCRSTEDSETRMMLLTAEAGAGKTAIAHSIAERCVREGILLSSFFFKAGEPWRPDSMFSAIARSLAAYDPVYRAFIYSTLRKDPSLSSAPFTTQFRRLVADPLRLRPPSSHRPAVIVIDALDECEWNAFMLLADVLRKEVSKLPFSVKIFLTSREVSLVNDFFSLVPLIQRLNINLSSGENMDDCAKYVCSQLCCLKGPPLGPTEQDTLARRLSEQSGGLFIWVSAIFRHVNTTNEASVATLKGLLETTADRTGAFAEIMDGFYTSVLEKCNWEDETFAHDYPIVLGAILNSQQPLCIAAWDAILSPSLQSSVKYTLTALVPVLMGVADPHTPIRFLDQSFHRFIIARTGSQPSGLRRYVLEAKKGCAWMATRCINILREGLPSTEGLGLIRDLQTETELPCIPSETLSEHFRYACRHVVYHLNQVQEPSETLQGLVRTFLDQHIIQWVEVCVRSGQYISISSLPEWAKLGLGSTSKEAAHMLVKVLTKLGGNLAYFSKLEEAHEAVNGSVVLCRLLVSMGSESYDLDLAQLLTDLLTSLHKVRWHSRAITVVEECVCRELVALDPTSHNPKLASFLFNQANTLRNLGRYSEALQVNEECVKLHRDLVALDPASYNPKLASSLKNQAHTLRNLGRNSEALQVDEECVKLRRELVALDPASYSPKLASSLQNQAHTLRNLGRYSEALQVDEECVKLHRDLVALDPASHNPKLADSLHN